MNTRVALGVVCRYSLRSGYEVRGSDSALHRLAETLLTSASSRMPTRIQCDDSSEVAPYDESIKNIEIAPSTSRSLQISYAPSEMRISGGPDPMRLLATNLEALIAGDAPHIHVEHYPGHFYLSDRSVPVVVTRT